MELILGLIVLVVVALVAFVIMLNRPASRDSDAEPGNPEEEGTSYEKPQDEGPR